jgi:hypothetical protein
LSFACIAALIAVICRKSRILIHFFPYLHFYKLLLMPIIKRLLWIVPLFILSASSLAQEKTVSGTVLSAKDDEPVANATVTNRNTKKNTTTTSTGRFTIKASRGDVLEITSVGHLKITVTVGDGTEIPVKMEVNEKQLSEVVVTSLGIKKEKRALSFSSQELKGDDVAQTQRENFSMPYKVVWPAPPWYKQVAHPVLRQTLCCVDSTHCQEATHPLLWLTGYPSATIHWTSTNWHPMEITGITIIPTGLQTSTPMTLNPSTF